MMTTCITCAKRVPPSYEEAHRRFHLRGNEPRFLRQRSAETTENIRLSRIRRRQIKAAATA